MAGKLDPKTPGSVVAAFIKVRELENEIDELKIKRQQKKKELEEAENNLRNELTYMGQQMELFPQKLEAGESKASKKKDKKNKKSSGKKSESTPQAKAA